MMIVSNSEMKAGKEHQDDDDRSISKASDIQEKEDEVDLMFADIQPEDEWQDKVRCFTIQDGDYPKTIFFGAEICEIFKKVLTLCPMVLISAIATTIVLIGVCGGGRG